MLKLVSNFLFWFFHPGYTTEVTEVLMQSNVGCKNILPTIPNAWESGSVRGIVARGGFELSIRWTGQAPGEITILSHNGGTCVIQFEAGQEFSVIDSSGNLVPYETVQENRISFETIQNESYTILNALL